MTTEEPQRLEGPQIWDGEYEKLFYWVHLPSGERVQCWPNAGIMNSTDGSGRQWRPEEGVLVSQQTDEESPFNRQDRIAEAAERLRSCSPLAEGLQAMSMQVADGNTGDAIRLKGYVVEEASPMALQPWRNHVSWAQKLAKGLPTVDHFDLMRRETARAKKERYRDKKRRRRGKGKAVHREGSRDAST